MFSYLYLYILDFRGFAEGPRIPYILPHAVCTFIHYIYIYIYIWLTIHTFIERPLLNIPIFIYYLSIYLSISLSLYVYIYIYIYAHISSAHILPHIPHALPNVAICCHILNVGVRLTPSPPTKSSPIKSPRVKLSGRLPMKFNGHENSHP